MASQTFIEKYKHFVKAGIDLTGGTIGGAASVFAGQPLDTVKVKMQAFPSLYTNSLVCLKETFMKEKFRGLYAGTVPSLVANCSENAILFCAYGACQSAVKLLVHKESVLDLNAMENALSGCFAAFLMSFSLCPTELIKCRLQVMRETKSPDSAKGPWQLTKDIFKREGISGLYKGLGITMFREMVGYFFFFGAIDSARTFFTPEGKTKEDIGALRTILAGACGGVSFWIAIFPSDVLKSRLQIMSKKQSSLNLTKEIIRKDGIRAMYKGLGPTIVRTCPATGALFLAYDYSTSFLRYTFSCPL